MRRALALLAIAAVAAASAVAVTRERSRPGAGPEPTVLERFAAADTLGGVVGGFGSAWLVDSTGDRLLRIDPRGPWATGSIPVRATGWLPIAAGDGALWVVESSGDGAALDTVQGPLLRVDPRSDRVSARIALRTPGGAPFEAWALLAGPGTVWVGGPGGALRVDPRTNRVAQLISTAAGGYETAGFGLGGGHLWVAVSDGRLLRFDARTGAATAQFRSPVLGDVLTLGGRLVVVGTHEIARMDPRSGRVLWRTSLGTIYTATAAGGRIWVSASSAPTARAEGDRLIALDARTGRVLANVGAGEFGIGGLTAVGPRLWMATAGGRIVIVQP
jgi:outer membrane protein assembly factor BamB